MVIFCPSVLLFVLISFCPSTSITRPKPCPDIPNIRLAYMCVCPSVYFVCLSFYLTVLLSVFCMSILLSICPSVHSSILLSVHFDHDTKTLPGHPKHQVSIIIQSVFVCLSCYLSVLLCVQFAMESVHFDHETKTLPGHPKHQVNITSVCLSICLLRLSILFSVRHPPLCPVCHGIRPL
jgi:hypothetical protein